MQAIINLINNLIIFVSQLINKFKQFWNGSRNHQNAFPENQDESFELVFDKQSIEQNQQTTTFKNNKSILRETITKLLKDNNDLSQEQISKLRQIQQKITTQTPEQWKKVQSIRTNFKAYAYPAEYFQFLLQFKLPCSFETYQNAIQTQNKQRDFNKLIDHYQCQSFGPPNVIYKMTMKKFMILQARKFKYSKVWGRVGQYCWQLCQSLLDNRQYCDFVSLATFQQIHDELICQIFIKADLHLTIKAQKLIEKGLNEIKSYYDNVYDFVNNRQMM